MRSVLISRCLIFLFIINYVSCACEIERYWKRHEFNNTKIIPYTVEQTVLNSQECVELCFNSTDCKSVGISTSFNCYMYNKNVYSGMEGVYLSETIYYYIPLIPENEIPSNYTCHQNESFCHKFCDVYQDWDTAEQTCEQDGGFLMLGNTPFKIEIFHQTLLNNASNTQKYAFIGATDRHGENIWNWLNGDPIDRTLFMIGRPDNYYNKQHCLSYRFDDLSMYGLDDIDCLSTNQFFCEITLKQ